MTKITKYKVLSVLPLLALTCGSAFADGRAGDKDEAGFLFIEAILAPNGRFDTNGSDFREMVLSQPGAIYAADLTIIAPAGEVCSGVLSGHIDFEDGTSEGAVLANVQAADGATESVSHDYTVPVRFRFKPDTDTAKLTVFLNKVGPASSGNCSLLYSVVFVEK